MKISVRLSIFAAIMFINTLSASIESISLTWLASVCRLECARNLDKQFHAIPAVNNVQINQDAGKAIMTLKPNAPFTFAPFNAAMEMVGLSIHDIRIIVKGSISRQGDEYLLISSGDNTPFVLVNPVVPQPGYVVQYNALAANRKLTPALLDQLEKARDARQVVTIEGPLFMPERSPPLMLVIEQIRF